MHLEPVNLTHIKGNNWSLSQLSSESTYGKMAVSYKISMILEFENQINY